MSVSTHSRAEAAALETIRTATVEAIVSTHSRAEAAARKRNHECLLMLVSTHSRAEAAAGVVFINK